MRIVIILFVIFAASLWGGIRMRKQDQLASGILFVFSGLSALGFIGGFFGWFGN